MAQPAKPSDANSLCKACGLCCDGSMFGTVALTANDKPDRLAVLQLEPEEQNLLFHQPCRAFVNQCCSIYSDRPQNCSNFRCEVLKKVESGQLPFQSALTLVQEMRALSDRLPAELRTMDVQQLAPRQLLELGTWKIMLGKKFYGAAKNPKE